MDSSQNPRPFMHRYRARWEQGRFVARDELVLLAWLTWQAFIRGSDYIRGLGLGSPDYMVLKAAYDPALVGLVFVAGAALIVGGVILNAHIFVWSGHVVLFVSYSNLTLATGFAMIGRAEWGVAWLIGAGAILAGVGVFLYARDKLSDLTWRLGLFALAALLLPLIILAPTAGGFGLRVPGIFFGAAIIHFLWALRTGYEPLAVSPGGEPVVEEQLISPPQEGE